MIHVGCLASLSQRAPHMRCNQNKMGIRTWSRRWLAGWLIDTFGMPYFLFSFTPFQCANREKRAKLSGHSAHLMVLDGVCISRSPVLDGNQMSNKNSTQFLRLTRISSNRWLVCSWLIVRFVYEYFSNAPHDKRVPWTEPGQPFLLRLWLQITITFVMHNN